MNLRVIKKDVDFLVGEVIDDAIIYLELNDNANEEKVAEIIDAALDLEDELVEKINSYAKAPKGRKEKRKTKGGDAKAYYKEVQKDLVEGIDALYEQLSALSAKKK